MNYKFTKGLEKSLIAAIIFAIPFVITSFPDVFNLTIGAVGIMLVNFLKIKYFNGR